MSSSNTNPLAPTKESLYRVQKARTPKKHPKIQELQDRKIWRRSTIVPVSKLETLRLLDVISDLAPRAGYLVNEKSRTIPLPSTEWTFRPTIKVVNKDTLDAAIAVEEAKDLLDTTDDRLVCVLNFANAAHIGGGWENGANAQEEQLCFRSTLPATLAERFYPLGNTEVIYSPTVIVFRENEEKGFSMMWGAEKPDSLPRFSVISAAAERDPKLSNRAGKRLYAAPESEARMYQLMLSILRTAAANFHTRLVLGAIGCGAFNHPPDEVATLWLKVLCEPEFKGRFELIVFAVFGGGENFQTFRRILHNYKIR